MINISSEIKTIFITAFITTVLNLVVSFSLNEVQFKNQKELLNKQFSNESNFQINLRNIEKKENVLIEMIMVESDYKSKKTIEYDRVANLISKINVYFKNPKVSCFGNQYVLQINSLLSKEKFNDALLNNTSKSLFRRLKEEMTNEIDSNKKSTYDSELQKIKINEKTCDIQDSNN